MSQLTHTFVVISSRFFKLGMKIIDRIFYITGINGQLIEGYFVTEGKDHKKSFNACRIERVATIEESNNSVKYGPHYSQN